MSIPYRTLRQLVVEALYEAENSDHVPADVLARRLEEAAEEDPALREAKGREFARRALDGVMEHMAEADALISDAAPRYPLSSMAVVDRNILRLAIWELLSDPAASAAAVVNEAVELAHRYGGEKSPAFVNGVLRTVSTHIAAERTAGLPGEASSPEQPQSQSRRSTR